MFSSYAVSVKYSFDSFPLFERTYIYLLTKMLKEKYKMCVLNDKIFFLKEYFEGKVCILYRIDHDIFGHKLSNEMAMIEFILHYFTDLCII